MLNENPEKVLVIAEIGVNHNGSLDLAKKLIDEAKQSGADAVKFQTFTASALVTPNTPKVTYQEKTTSRTESHFEMIKSLELSQADHHVLFDYCHKSDIQFISTPYDIQSAQFLSELGVSCFKTASADIVDLPLHKYLASLGKPVYVATGMADLAEIEEALTYYKHKSQVTLLHCVSNYPCSIDNLNLRAINLLRKTFQTQVGYSDHSENFLAATLSVALGAAVIERHFTLDKTLPGPDHKASSTPKEFAQYVSQIRQAEIAMGKETKHCQPEEKQMALVSRKSLVLKHTCKKGQILESEDLTLKRPGTGLYARELDKVLGKKVKQTLPADHQISFEDLEA